MAELHPEPNNPHRLEVDSGFSVRVPSRQPAFLITDADWKHIKDLISSIHSIESHWFTALSFFLTLGGSFLAGFLVLEQQNPVAFAIRASFLTSTVVGFVAGLLCFIVFLSERRRRKAQVAVVLQYMDQIEASLTPSQPPG